MIDERLRSFLIGLMCGALFCVGAYVMVKGLEALAYDYQASVIP